MGETATIGVLFDGNMGPAASLLAEAVAAGVADSSFKGECKVLTSQPNGLSSGSEHEFRRGFMELADAGVLGIVGPGITDNGFIARDLANECRIPSIIWAAHEELRSPWSFHFQLGSLEEEPPVLLRHLAAHGIKRIALVHDDATIIHRYVQYLAIAQRFIDVEVVSRAMMSPEIADAGAVIEAVRRPDAEALIYFGLGRSAEPVGRAMRAAGWNIPVVGCSSLMMGRARPEMAETWDGWVSVAMETDSNPAVARAAQLLPREVVDSPVGLSFFDMGRLIGEGLDRAGYRTRASLREGLERVKHLPATIGHPGTMMTLGHWDRAILKGPYLVLHEWNRGKSAPLRA